MIGWVLAGLSAWTLIYLLKDTEKKPVEAIAPSLPPIPKIPGVPSIPASTAGELVGVGDTVLFGYDKAWDIFMLPALNLVTPLKVSSIKSFQMVVSEKPTMYNVIGVVTHVTFFSSGAEPFTQSVTIRDVSLPSSAILSIKRNGTVIWSK